MPSDGGRLAAAGRAVRVARDPGGDPRAAAAVCWGLAKANETIAYMGSLLASQELIGWFGVKRSVSQRAEVFLKAIGVIPYDQYDEMALGSPDYLEHYWDSFWDEEQVFYGHVLGFKGLERRAVVLALNEREPRERSRERLYVGLSRARDQLVVCGDPDFVAEVGGSSVLRRLRGD
jgi:hypothetical protein